MEAFNQETSMLVCAQVFDDEEGVDVFSCEYEYDAKWKRFRRRQYTHGGRMRMGSDDEADSDYQANTVLHLIQYLLPFSINIHTFLEGVTLRKNPGWLKPLRCPLPFRVPRC